MMTNGPNAKVGKIMEVDLPRPRTRKQLLEHPDYYRLREELLSFLEEYEHGPAQKVDPSATKSESNKEETPQQETESEKED